jgi:hypothetical protein
MKKHQAAEERAEKKNKKANKEKDSSQPGIREAFQKVQ